VSTSQFLLKIDGRPLLKIDGRSVGLFAFGLSSAVRFQLTGELYLTDLLTLPLLLFVVAPAWRRLPWRFLRPLLMLMVVWFASLVITDLYRATPLANLERGWLKIIFFAAALLCVSALSEFKIGRLMALAAGFATAQSIATTFFPDDYERVLPWKFGFADPLATLAVILASLPFRWRLGVRAVPPALMAAANLVLGFRSLFGVLVATVGATCLAALANRASGRPFALRASTVILVAVCAVVGAFGTIATYSALASRGFLGRDEQARYAEQTQGTGSLLFVGRTDAFVAAKAITDSPILGHGSWAAEHSYIIYEVDMLRAHGVKASSGAYRSDLIPSHSYILGAWVEAGIAGAAFWAVVLVLTVNGFVRMIGTGNPATPFAAFALSSLLWDIPFSPFGADVRFVVAGQLCVVIWAFGTHMPAARRRQALRELHSTALLER
jgi:hypothetical protein